MFAYIWPLALVIVSNVVYQICTKSVPDGLDPFASLGVTYLVGAAISLILYFAFNRKGDLLHEMKQLNWVPFVLGVVIVGLEVGYIFAYRAGWQVSTAPIVQSAFLAVILLFVGLLVYGEKLSWNKIIGVIVCLAGLTLINLK